MISVGPLSSNIETNVRVAEEFLSDAVMRHV